MDPNVEGDMQLILQDVASLRTYCDEAKLDPWRFGQKAILIDNASIIDKHWLCAKPLVYWPIVTRYLAACHQIHVLVALGRMTGTRVSRRVVMAYVLNGKWYDRTEIPALLANPAIRVDMKISFMLARRQRDGPVRHDLLHPFFVYESNLQFESHPPTPEGKRSLNKITQFMHWLECGPQKKNNVILSKEISGVLVEELRVSADVAQNNSFPMVVTQQALDPALRYLVDD